MLKLAQKELGGSRPTHAIIYHHSRCLKYEHKKVFEWHFGPYPVKEVFDQSVSRGCCNTNLTQTWPRIGLEESPELRKCLCSGVRAFFQVINSQGSQALLHTSKTLKHWVISGHSPVSTQGPHIHLFPYSGYFPSTQASSSFSPGVQTSADTEPRQWEIRGLLLSNHFHW